jgi:5-methylthioadenosine/S-adenosylhomocysteine deaminase
MNGRATLIKARWVVGFDGREHRLIENGCVAYAGDKILHVGTAWEGEASETIEAPDHLVIPGLISTHAHIGAGLGDRLIVDAGRRDLLRSGFLNYEPRREGRPGFGEKEDKEASIRFGMACLIRHGVTTVVEMGGAVFDKGRTMARLVGESGLRVYYAPMITAGDYRFGSRGELERLLDEREGDRTLEEACAFADEFHARHDGRLQAILVINEAYNATPRLMRRTKEEARRRGLGITLHIGEQVWEFHHALRSTGKTPVAILEAEGLLGPEVILGHCRFTGGNSMTAYPYDDDLDIVARSGATVAHAPLAGTRRGGALESFDRYRKRGIRMSMGTDTYPLDMISEMRWASIICKIEDANHEAAPATAVFNAATLGGADALRRPDLGRLQPGAKADIAIVNLATLRAGPVRDPIRTLVHAATGECVDTVIVDGRTLLRHGRLTLWDEREILRAVRSSAKAVWEAFPRYHWSGEGVDQVFPPSFPAWNEPATRTHSDEAP